MECIHFRVFTDFDTFGDIRHPVAIGLVPINQTLPECPKDHLAGPEAVTYKWVVEVAAIGPNFGTGQADDTGVAGQTFFNRGEFTRRNTFGQHRGFMILPVLGLAGAGDNGDKQSENKTKY